VKAIFEQKGDKNLMLRLREKRGGKREREDGEIMRYDINKGERENMRKRDLSEERERERM
jgi:hypothetical protein